MRWKTPFIISIGLLCMAVQCFHFENTTLLSSVKVTKINTGVVIAESSLLDMQDTLSQHGHVYSLSPNPILGFNSQASTKGPLKEKETFVDTIRGLSNNQSYFIRAYAIANSQIYYGKEVLFTADGLKPDYVITLGVSNISSTSAEVKGRIEKLSGTSPQFGHLWSTANIPDNQALITNQFTSNANGTQNTEFTSAFTGLKANTQYYIRSYMKVGSTIIYGNQVSFTTPN